MLLLAHSEHGWRSFFSAFSQTLPIGCQLRMLHDQRPGYAQPDIAHGIEQEWHGPD